MKSVKKFWLSKLWLICFSSLLVCILNACNSGSTAKQTLPPTITSFSINGVPGIISRYDNNGATTDYNITLQLPESTTLTDLVPVFSLSQNATSVSVNGNPTYSASSHNNFSYPLVYTVNGSTPGYTTTYTVAVNYGVLTSNVTESMYYSLTTGLSSEVVVSLNGAYAANGQMFISQQVYLYGDQLLQGNPAYTLVKLGMAKDEPTQPPVGSPAKNVAIAAIILFLPSVIDIVGDAIITKYYYPPLEYEIPVVP